MLKWFRQIHLYLGIFTAPAILFFAFSGALQTLGLNDASPDGHYKPSHWISVMAQIHKKQSPVLPQRRPFPPGQPAGAAAPKKADVALQSPAPQGPGLEPQRPPQPIAMKVFFLLVCASLWLSTFSGAYMGWKFKRNRVALGAVFVAGIVAPILLLTL